MSSNLFNVPPPFNMVVFIVLIIFATSAISEIAKQVRKFFSHRQELALKRELVDRGLSIEEIERVVSASKKSDDVSS